MNDYIIIAVLAILILLAIRYIVRAKKNGKKCIGCPDGGCSSCPSCASGSHCRQDKF